MLRDIREYAEQGVGLLLRLQLTLVQLPSKIFNFIWHFLIWLTGDFDIGYIFFDVWAVWMLYLTCGIIQTYTNFFGYTWDFIVFVFNMIITIIMFSSWCFFTYWLPFLILLVIGLGSAHFHYKKHRELHELMASYIDDEEDMPVNFKTIHPQPIGACGWGDRDEDYEPTPNFVAPSLFIKISGMVGMFPGMTIEDNIQRMNKCLKQKICPQLEVGPFPWAKLSVNTGTALIYMKFRTIEGATACFNILDGFSFDG